MTSDLDKYGLVALTIIVVLILFIAVNDLNDDDVSPDEPVPGIRLDDILPEEEVETEGDDVVIILDSGDVRNETDGFNFMEQPVDYPGGPSNVSGGTEARPGGGESRNPPHSTARQRIHRVRRGETLTGISDKYLGSSTLWHVLVDANPGVNPKSLRIGQKLVIPNPSGTTSKKATPSVDKVSTVKLKERLRYHQVRKGDTLGRISKIYYGSSSKWRRIFDANRNAIPNLRKLKIGTRLVIPY